MCRSAREEQEVVGSHFDMKGSGSFPVNPITSAMVLPWQLSMGSMLSVLLESVFGMEMRECVRYLASVPSALHQLRVNAKSNAHLLLIQPLSAKSVIF